MTTGRLSLRDVYAGLLVGAMVALVIGWHAGAVLPGMASPRMLGAAVLVLGVAGCAIGADPELATERAAKSPVITALAEIGALTLVVALVSIIAGSQLLVSVTVALTVALWVAATIRHAVRPDPAAEPSHHAVSHDSDRTPVGV